MSIVELFDSCTNFGQSQFVKFIFDFLFMAGLARCVPSLALWELFWETLGITIAPTSGVSIDTDAGLHQYADY